jgi:hypothetical protein
MSGSLSSMMLSAMGGVNPASMVASPQTGNLLNMYYSMTPNQLQQTVARLGLSTPLGQMANAILQQKLMMPNVGGPAAQQIASQGPQAGSAPGVPAAPTAPTSVTAEPTAGAPAALNAVPTVAAPLGGGVSGTGAGFGGMLPGVSGPGVMPLARGGAAPSRLQSGGVPMPLPLGAAMAGGPYGVPVSPATGRSTIPTPPSPQMASPVTSYYPGEAQMLSALMAQQAANRADGGRILPKAFGGGMLGVPMSEADPWWIRRDVAADRGLIHSSVPGRTDHVAAAPMVDSYVIPADVVAGLGEGNTLAGAKVLSMALNVGPYGTQMPRGRGHDTIPRPPRPEFAPSAWDFYPGEGRLIQGLSGFDSGPALLPYRQAAGGVTRKEHDADPQKTRIFAAGGEFIVPPEVVKRLGGGSTERGHKILDEFVVKARKHIIDEMKKLKPPVKH